MEKKLKPIWLAIIRPLSRIKAVREPGALPPYTPSAECRPHVILLEKASSSTILVTWQDARLGRHAEQVWHRCVAKQGGTCILSGLPYRRSEMVYRPRPFKGQGTLIDACIAAEAADRLLATASSDDFALAFDPAY